MLDTKEPGNSTLNLRFFAKPPVIELKTMEEKESAIAQMENNVFETVAHDGSDPEVMAWNERINDSTSYIDYLSIFLQSPMAAYVVAHQAIGVMVLGLCIKNLPLNIAILVTLPGSESAGGALVEHAVNLVAALNQDNTQVSIKPASAHAELVYKNWGFLNTKKTTHTDPTMILTPRTSEKWGKDEDNRWRLKSNIGKLFLG